MYDRAGFLKDVQRRIARVAVGASTVRSAPEGTRDAACNFLASVKLDRFGRTTEREFGRVLNAHTDRLKCKLPNESWGLARKLLNIFLRDALYCRYLYDAHSLATMEPWLEVPLDRIVMKAIKDEALMLGRDAPGVTKITDLRPSDSREFQRLAGELAKSEGYCRVHLDTKWWSNR